MTRKQYKSSTPDKQPGYPQKQHLWNGACCIHTQSTHHIKVSYLNIKKQSSFSQSTNSLCSSCSFTKSTQGLRWRNEAFPENAESNSGHWSWWPQSWKLKIQRREAHWDVAVDKRLQRHCYSPSDLPKSRDLGPGRGASWLTPGPWETEIWDISLPIISFTEK